MQVIERLTPHTGEDPEGGGLARAIDAQQTEALALPDGRADAGDRPHRQLPVGGRIRLRDAVQQHLTAVRIYATYSSMYSGLWSMGYSKAGAVWLPATRSCQHPRSRQVSAAS